MQSKTVKLKKFIKNFNYPDPSWDDLPSDFPNCDRTGLSPHEEGLLSGIVLIWYANHGGRPKLYKKFAQSLALIIAIIGSGIMLKNILVSDMFGRVVTVNAATVSGTLRATVPSIDSDGINAGSVLESTVSGLLRKGSAE